mgnify:CR=1 FL=1
MKYYKQNNEVYAYELDGSQDHLITEDMKLISLEEIEVINQTKENEYKTTLEYKTNEANGYLAQTDWVNSYKIRHDLGLELIPEESSKLEVINKREEYIVFLKGL